MIEDAIKAIKESSESSSVYVGADSQVFKRKDKTFAKYTAVVIIHKDSKHGASIHHESMELPEYGNLKQRLMNEVNFAVGIANQIIDVIGKRKMQIHLDINPDENYESSVAIKEAIGYVKGMGYEAVVKPNAFAATHAADHMVRN